LIFTDIRVARVGGDLLTLTLQGEIDGRDFILGLHGIVGNPIDGYDELGHGGDSFSS
jgi:hypothetical protein